MTSGITKPDTPNPLSTFVGKPSWDDAQSLASYCTGFVGGRSAELEKLTGLGTNAAPSLVARKATDLAMQYDDCSLRALGNGPVAAFARFRAAEAYLIAADATSDAATRRSDLALAIARAQRAEELQRYFQVETKLNFVRLQTGGDSSITGVLVKPWTDAIVTYARAALTATPQRRRDMLVAPELR